MGLKERRLDAISKGGRALLLSYDHGLEHGPADFDQRAVDPKAVLDIGLKGGFTGVVLQTGVAQRYYTKRYAALPLVIKLNGKTALSKGEPRAALLGSVEEAERLGAAAVGFTVYPGSSYEAEMLREFAEVRAAARALKMPVIAWVYPRGKSVKNETSRESLAYAARIGLEIGADLIKIKYGGKPADLEWAVRCAGRTKVLVAGGFKKEESSFLQDARDVMAAGAAGMAVGRNVWLSSDPLSLAAELQKIIFGTVQT